MSLLNIIVPVYEAKDSLSRLFYSVASSAFLNDISLTLVFDHDGLDYSEGISRIKSVLDTNEIVNNTLHKTLERNEP